MLSRGWQPWYRVASVREIDLVLTQWLTQLDDYCEQETNSRSVDSPLPGESQKNQFTLPINKPTNDTHRPCQAWTYTPRAPLGTMVLSDRQDGTCSCYLVSRALEISSMGY